MQPVLEAVQRRLRQFARDLELLDGAVADGVGVLFRVDSLLEVAKQRPASHQELDRIDPRP